MHSFVFIAANLLALFCFAKLTSLFFADRGVLDSLGGYMVFFLYSYGVYMTYPNQITVLWVGALAVFVVILNSDQPFGKTVNAVLFVLCALMAVRFLATLLVMLTPENRAPLFEYALVGLLLGTFVNICYAVVYAKNKGSGWGAFLVLQIFFGASGLFMTILVFEAYGITDVVKGIAMIVLFGGCAFLCFFQGFLHKRHQESLSVQEQELTQATRDTLSKLNLTHNDEIINLRVQLVEEMKTAGFLLERWRLDDLDAHIKGLIEKLDD